MHKLDLVTSLMLRRLWVALLSIRLPSVLAHHEVLVVCIVVTILGSNWLRVHIVVELVAWIRDAGSIIEDDWASPVELLVR